MSRAKTLSLALSSARRLCSRSCRARTVLSPSRRSRRTAREIAFASGGDIWTVPAAGGEARLLVADPATESRPLYSPDGKRLAFVSTRTGNGDIYVLTLATGELRAPHLGRRAPTSSTPGRATGAGSTSRRRATTSPNMNDVYRVRAGGRHADGGERRPLRQRVLLRALARRPDARLHRPAASRRSSGGGTGTAISTRRRSGCCDERGSTGAPALRAGAAGGAAKDLWPMWSPDGAAIFYIARTAAAPRTSGSRRRGGRRRRRGAHPLHRRPGALADDLLATAGRSSSSATSASGARHGDAARAAEVADHAARRARRPGDRAPERSRPSFQQLALSPDGKKVAFVAHGDVFAASAKDGGDAARVTDDAGAESQVAWAPDSRRLVYVSERDGARRHASISTTSRPRARDRGSPTAAGDDTPQLLARRQARSPSSATARSCACSTLAEPASDRQRAGAGLLDSPPARLRAPLAWSPTAAGSPS